MNTYVSMTVRVSTDENGGPRAATCLSTEPAYPNLPLPMYEEDVFFVLDIEAALYFDSGNDAFEDLAPSAVYDITFSTGEPHVVQLP